MWGTNTEKHKRCNDKQLIRDGKQDGQEHRRAHDESNRSYYIESKKSLKSTSNTLDHRRKRLTLSI